MRQKTIKSEISFGGKALQTGGPSRVVLKPASFSSGIIFRRHAQAEGSEFRINDFSILQGAASRRSALGKDGFFVQTVEHFLAALWALEIDNIVVEVDGAEMPAFDGSAIEFYRQIEKAGLEEQPREREFIVITEKEEVRRNGASLAIYPFEGFSVSYCIDYDIASIGREVFQIDLDRFSFEKEIAPARTFCLAEEAQMLLASGLGKGANLENTLVMTDDGPVGTRLRFPNEPVRHKVLDLVGDLYMLGRPVAGRVVAEKSGHSLNGEMVQRLYDKYLKGE